MYASPTAPMQPRSAALRLIPLALVLAVSQAYGATPVGQTGLAGAHGAAPGAAGGNDGNGGDGIASVVNGPSIEVSGGQAALAETARRARQTARLDRAAMGEMPC